MIVSTVTDYGALSGLQRFIGFVLSLVTSIFVSWVRKDKSGVASAYLAQAQKVSIIATVVFLIVTWGFWANSDHLRQLAIAACVGILTCFLAYLTNVWIVERCKGAQKTLLVITFLASYIIYTCAGSSGLSSAGLFATVLLGNSQNPGSAAKIEQYQLRAILHGSRDVTEDQVVPFRASSGQVNVNCDQSASGSVQWTLPAGAKIEGPVLARWEATDNVKGVNAPPTATISGDVVSATGAIIGLNKQNFAFGISNCPGGGHGQLVIVGQYVATTTHSTEQAPVDLAGELNSRVKTLRLSVPNSADFRITSCSIKLFDKASQELLDEADVTVQQPAATFQQNSSKGRFSVSLSGQILTVNLLAN